MTDIGTETTEKRLSPVESAKAGSAGLAGRIAEQLNDGADGFGADEKHLIKFHGFYQQKNRDERSAPHSFMLRVRIPGGRLTPDQYLLCDEIATRFGNASLRFTTRQSIQFYGLAKKSLKPAIGVLRAAGLTTAAACGDVVRTVVLLADPAGDARLGELETLARRLSTHFLYQSAAYEEIWFNSPPGSREEPLYGATYLPRKFKIAMTIDGENGPDLLTNDLGFAATFSAAGELTGFFVYAGGGLGMLPARPATFPRLADLIGWISADHLFGVAQAAVEIHRDHGDRSDRHHARLKYLLAERGAAWFREELERRSGIRLEKRDPLPWTTAPPPDRIRRADGAYTLGLRIPFGRVADRDGRPLRTTLRLLIRDLRLFSTLTPDQSLLLHPIKGEMMPEVQERLAGLGVLAGDYPVLMARALACPALPTCPLALTESERVAGDLVVALQRILDQLDLSARAPVLRMTGCPNGCARPATAELAIVGEHIGVEGIGQYALYAGGNLSGTRLAAQVASRVPRDRIPERLERLFRLWRTEGGAEERLGDFAHRAGVERLTALLKEEKA